MKASEPVVWVLFLSEKEKGESEKLIFHLAGLWLRVAGTNLRYAKMQRRKEVVYENTGHDPCDSEYQGQ